MKLIYFIIISFFALELRSQDVSYTIEVSHDTILLGNNFELKYSVKNTQVNFLEIPEFEFFDIVSGPNQSSNMSFVNGEMSSQMSLSFFLRPKEVGTFVLPEPNIKSDSPLPKLEAKKIFVLDNPDGIKIDPDSIKEKQKQNKKVKKKRKIYRI